MANPEARRAPNPCRRGGSAARDSSSDFLSPAVAAGRGGPGRRPRGRHRDGDRRSCHPARTSRSAVRHPSAATRSCRSTTSASARPALLLASKQTSAHTLCVVARRLLGDRGGRRAAEWRAESRRTCRSSRAPCRRRAARVSARQRLGRRRRAGRAPGDQPRDRGRPRLPGPRRAGRARRRRPAPRTRSRPRSAMSRAAPGPKKLTVDDLAGGTFTITNPGAVGHVDLVPDHQPAAGRHRRRPTACRSRSSSTSAAASRIAPVGHLCLTFDHRAMDGAYAGAFLGRVHEIVETRDWSTEL